MSTPNRIRQLTYQLRNGSTQEVRARAAKELAEINAHTNPPPARTESGRTKPN